MMGNEADIIITALITGTMAAVGSSLLTVAGLRVHIEYLRKADEKHDANIISAHRRIDELLEKGRCST